MLGKAEKINWAPVILKPNVLIFPVVVVMVMLGLGLLVIGPTIRAVMDKREQVRQEQERLEKLVEKRETLESLSVEEMTWELEVLNRVLASRKPIVGIMGSMMGVATASGLVLEQYTFKPGSVASEEAELTKEDKPGVISALAVSLGISGLYEDVIRYMRQIQASSPIAKYVTADLDGTIGEEEAPQFSQKMELEVYYAMPPLVKGKISDPLPPISPNKDMIIQKAEAYQDYAISLVEDDSLIQLQKSDPFNY